MLTPTRKSKVQKSLKICVLGGGSFGTAMANLAASNRCDSTLWVRSARAVKYMKNNQINKDYLPDHKLHDQLKYTSDLEEAVKGKDIVFVAVPSHAFRGVLQSIAPMISAQAVVSLTKGIEKDTIALMSQVIAEELPQVPFGVISGPNLATEIMNKVPSATVIASKSAPLKNAVYSALNSPIFQVFTSDDVLGVELGGSLKNIYAVAMGMADAYEIGENTRSMILTRALAEMSRLGSHMGASPLTFLGLSGVGDLFATCSSNLSRNYRMGHMLGQGLSIKKASKKLGQTAEGINTIQQARVKAQELGIFMPITDALYEIIFEDKPPLAVAFDLLDEGQRSDVEFSLSDL